jgi:hypothetical protein
MTSGGNVAPFKTPRGLPLGTLAFLGCLGLTGVGIILAAFGSFRQGAGYVGTALLMACLARFVIPDHMAGLLRVRRKALDVVLLGGFGVGIVVLTLLVRDVRGG